MGVNRYDQWIAHDIPFDHPSVVRAIERVDRLAHGEGNLPEGALGASATSFLATGPALDAEDPACHVAQYPSFLPGTIGNIDPNHASVTSFPLVDGVDSEAVIGAGIFAVALSDRPEVREVIRFMASPEFGAGGASVSPGYVPPNRNFDIGSISSDVGREIARITYAALEEDQFRFDASDLMPSEVGTNAFFQGMVDLFTGEPGRAAEIATGIETAWSALEAGCADPDALRYDIGLPECGES